MYIYTCRCYIGVLVDSYSKRSIHEFHKEIILFSLKSRVLEKSLTWGFNLAEAYCVSRFKTLMFNGTKNLFMIKIFPSETFSDFWD